MCWCEELYLHLYVPTYIADVSFFNIRFLSEQETDSELLSFEAERKEKEQEKFKRKSHN